MRDFFFFKDLFNFIWIQWDYSGKREFAPDATTTSRKKARMSLFCLFDKPHTPLFIYTRPAGRGS